MERVIEVDLEKFPDTGVNFQPFRVSFLPEDCVEGTSTLRLEQAPGRTEEDESTTGISPWSEANYSTLRTIIKGTERKIRIKQFFYDWAPMAAGIPCLWESGELTPLVIHNAIAWIGVDYLENVGATLHRNGTLIEFSVVEGTFDHHEISKIVEGLLPVAVSSEILRVVSLSFFKKNYWIRHAIKGLRVPHGLYKKNRFHDFSKARYKTPEELAHIHPVLPQSIGHYAYNSAIGIKNETDEEIEIIYLSEYNHNDYIWVHIAPAHTPLPLPPDSHPIAESTTINKAETLYYFCTNHVEYGGHECHWQHEDLLFMAWSSSALQLSYKEFQSLILNAAQSLFSEPK